MVSTWETVVAAIGRLALAVELDSSPLARPGAPPARPGAAPGARRGRLRTGPNLLEAATYAVVAACWLQERRTLTGRGLDKDARATVTVKDVLVTGAVVTGVANLVGERIMGCELAAGAPVTASGDLARKAPPGAARRRRCLVAVRALNRAFVAGAVAATPFINFALFNDYRPRPLRSFLSL